MNRPLTGRRNLPIAMLAIGVIVGASLWLADSPAALADGAGTQLAASDSAAAVTVQGSPAAADPYDPDSDDALQDKTCQRDDPCMRTKAKWVSPRRMQDRFEAGVLKNANKVLLPLRIRKMATKKWNEDHGVVGQAIDVDDKGDVWDCDGHWWCKPLDVGSCVVSTFLCAAQNVGWDQAKSVTMKCGGLALIAGGYGLESGDPGKAALGAAATSSACVYGTLGDSWGWWNFP